MSTLLNVERPGKLLKANGVLAQALIESGATVRAAAKQAGVSRSTAERMSRRQKANRYSNALRDNHVALIKNSIRDRFLSKSSELLDAITGEDIKKASLLEKVKASSICLENAGLGPAPIGDLHQTFFFAVNTSGSQADSTSRPQAAPLDVTPSTSTP